MAPNSILLSVLFLLLLSTGTGLESDDALRFVKNHLKASGYLSGDYNSAADVTYDEALAYALRKYQHFHGLNVSGRIEPHTLMMMSRHRGSVPDHSSAENIMLQYAFSPGNPKWPKHMRRLKYIFTTSKPIPSKNVSEAIWRAFSTWSAVTEFTFKEAKGFFSTPQIKIGFYRREHGCPKPFDGRGGSFAHAFPPINGTMHFDKDEDWGTVRAPNILDLESVALHEIGHLLGLDHSGRRSAVMYRTFSYGQIKRELDQDDIDGIRALYAD